MRIAITGSHGVGKTTLAKAVAEKFNLLFIAEMARAVANTMNIFHTNAIVRSDVSRKVIFQETIWQMQLAAEESLDSFVSDRSILDVVAYSLYYGLDGFRWQKRREWAVNYARFNYDLLIYLPVRFKPEDDGFRLADAESQAAVNELIRDMFRDVSNEVFASERMIAAVKPGTKAAKAHNIISFAADFLGRGGCGAF
jgi:nicotinamide riboside kinase